MSESLPRWDLQNVFPSLGSKEYDAANSELENKIHLLESYLDNNAHLRESEPDIQELADSIGNALNQLNSLYQLSGSIGSYLQSFITTDSRDKIAAKKLSEFEQLEIRILNLNSVFQARIGSLSPKLEILVKANTTAAAHVFNLMELAEQSKYMMSQPEETLANELSLSGTTAWSKLQGTVTSQLSVDFELDGKVQKLPMPALINLHSHPAEDVRRRAYETELSAWKTVEEPLAAAMNGIKGTAITLNKHRGRIDALHSAIDMARLDRPTLEVMLSAMHDSFPVFRRYFSAKAKRLGKEKLAFWDLFAPVGKTKKQFRWNEAREYIITNFNTFSPELGSFANHAFEKNWIDAEPREGKRGGAFCMGVPAVKESRILCNFDGTLDQVTTVAHELGHAFHNECAYKAGKTEIQRDTPMTLAETASIMCETIVMEAMLEQTIDPQEKLAILETSLIGDSQVIVDIYSRYLFEKEVFERRVNSELSAEDLCEIMERSQRSTYGDGLDDRYLMKYMWTWKPHYYSSGLAFYNFPYAFGLLFSTGLYAVYRDEGPSFVKNYTDLLANTGESTAANLAARFNIDIHDKKFWTNSLKVIEEKIDLYERL